MANTLNNLNYQQINLFDLRMNDVILLLEAEVLDGVNTNAGNPYSEIVHRALNILALEILQSANFIKLK